ncbi:hypothetical protein CNMCM5793_007795 [Aspergillus hiratsukae]|uniref:Secreted protein CSS2 C-terminal domain-containing protein n=1 Tax=Aspergillus hiratsukae TaxID=1194566 RepID=A0A8H6PPM0_9EURO|nr:hypothetical protein CNMCM5793_007795 [Aspergillus hiratsukae]KAF7157804.1 hypothetical protein CNMCM6106_003933 [Aspergillus hiratsukae]
MIKRDSSSSSPNAEPEPFYNFCDRTICPILLHITVVLDAYQYYVVREDCVDNGVLRANLSLCVMLATVWHRMRAPDKRTSINVCLNVCQAILIALAFLGLLDLVTVFSPGFSGIVKGLFDRHSCRNMTGTFDHVKWSFYATGQHCNTTAQEDVIQGAVAKYIRNAENGTICGTQCLRLDHGGTWNGWLKYYQSVSAFKDTLNVSQV